MSWAQRKLLRCFQPGDLIQWPSAVVGLGLYVFLGWRPLREDVYCVYSITYHCVVHRYYGDDDEVRWVLVAGIGDAGG